MSVNNVGSNGSRPRINSGMLCIMLHDNGDKLSVVVSAGEDRSRAEHSAGVPELLGGRHSGVQSAAQIEPSSAPRLLRAAMEGVLAHDFPGLVSLAGCGAARMDAVEWHVRARHSAVRRVWQPWARR